MNPLSISPLHLLLAILAAAAVGAGGGWTANGWRLGEQISEKNAERSDEIAGQRKQQVDDLVADLNRINTAADAAGKNMTALDGKLRNLNKGFENEKPPALPVDCVLDDVRLRQLQAAAGEVNTAISRQKP